MTAPVMPPKARNICEAVCIIHSLTVDELFDGKFGSSGMWEARGEAYCRLHAAGGYSWPRIAAWFGRNHSTLVKVAGRRLHSIPDVGVIPVDPQPKAHLRRKKRGQAACMKRTWAKAEIQLLKSHPDLSVKALARKFQEAGRSRTPRAIQCYREHLARSAS